MNLSWELVWLCLVALAAGAVNSIAGGGTLVTFPALLAGLSFLGPADGAVFANATSTVAHWEGFAKAVASGQTTHGTGAMKTRATHKAGHKLYVSVAFSVVKDREGKAIGAMATARQFTEDKTQ